MWIGDMLNVSNICRLQFALSMHQTSKFVSPRPTRARPLNSFKAQSSRWFPWRSIWNRLTNGTCCLRSFHLYAEFAVLLPDHKVLPYIMAFTSKADAYCPSILQNGTGFPAKHPFLQIAAQIWGVSLETFLAGAPLGDQRTGRQWWP